MEGGFAKNAKEKSKIARRTNRQKIMEAYTYPQLHHNSPYDGGPPDVFYTIITKNIYYSIELRNVGEGSTDHSPILITIGEENKEINQILHRTSKKNWN